MGLRSFLILTALALASCGGGNPPAATKSAPPATDDIAAGKTVPAEAEPPAEEPSATPAPRPGRLERTERRGADLGALPARQALQPFVADPADELAARQGRGRRDLLVRLPALLRARSGRQELGRRASPSTSASYGCRSSGATSRRRTRARSTPRTRSARSARCTRRCSARSTTTTTCSIARTSCARSSARSASTRRRSARRTSRPGCRRRFSAPTSSAGATASRSVPTIVVNGKYVTDAGMAGGTEQLFALIGELAASEHSGK